MTSDQSLKAKEDFFVDPVLKQELEKIKHAVTKKDRDFVMVVDGEEGSGKSVLAMQIAKYLDSRFDLRQLVFNSDQFLDMIKVVPKNSCIVLDEAYAASNARASLSEVNRSMIGVATEMRQRNLYVIFVLPTFFDLDKYFALWRCRALIHVYFNKEGGRGRYIIFPKTQKKLLYLNGKKKYDYSKPQSPYPACRFFNYYPVDEVEYRLKKSRAFKKRAVSNRTKEWLLQRNALIVGLLMECNFSQQKVSDLLVKYNAKALDRTVISDIHKAYTLIEETVS